MPQFSRALDVYQGYNFKKDVQTAVGYITAMKVQAKDLPADQNVPTPDPDQQGADTSVVAVLTRVYWGTGLTDAIYFSGQISNENRKTLAEAVINSLTNVEIEFTFDVYEYDPGDKEPAYFKCISGENLRGLVEKSGEDLSLAVANMPSDEVQSPQNFSFQVGIKPQAREEKTITIGVSKSAKIPKKWGIKVGK